MSQNTRAQNSGQEGELRRNNPPQYNLRPLLPQVEEQEGNKPPSVARRRTTRHQPRRETRTKCLEQRIDTLTDLVNTLVTALGQNATNATPTIPLGIPFANVKGKEGSPPQKGEDVAAGEAQADTDKRQRRARSRRQTRHKNRGNAPELHEPEHTRDSVFNRLEQTRTNPNLYVGYDSEYERSASSRESANLRAQLNTRRARPEQQAESIPPI